MQKRVLLLGLTLAILALALWFALARRPDTDAVAVQEPAPPAAGRTAAAVAETETARAVRTDATVPAARVSNLRVRSSAGIPLAFVEVERGGSWVRHELVDGVIDALTEKLPALLRAPGHVARLLEASEGELVLEPDALLVIGGAQLRSCLVEVSIEEEACARLADWRAARERAVVSGWTSDAAFAIAVAADRLEPIPRALPIVVVRADRLRSYLELEVRPGMRATWNMPCDGQSAALPLDVRVERLPGMRNPIQLVLLCSAPTGSAGVEDAPWGSVALSTTDLNERIVLRANEEMAHFPDALVGRAHVLGAMDESTHAYGRIGFVHDGRQQTLVLREALEIRGRVVEAQSRNPLRRVHLYLDGLGSPGWRVEAQDLELDPRGCFALRAPERAPEAESMQLEPPGSWTLGAEQPGFDAREFLRFERGGESILDVGEIALVRHKNPIALAPGHGLGPRELDGHYVVFADKPEEAWPTLVGVVLDDGRFEIECRTGKGDRSAPVMMRANLLTGVEEWVPFERPLGTALLVHIVDDVRSFRLESDGLYHRVPEDFLDLALRTEALPADGKSWKIGWTWGGAWIRVGQLASDVAGNEVRAKINVPHGAQQIWWSSTGIPPDLRGDPGGSQAITGSSMKVVLR